MGARFQSEFDMVESLALSLKCSGYSVYSEVPSMGKSADLVATRGRWVLFIEAKLANWRRALEQCSSHKLVADHVAIAIGNSAATPEFLSIIQEKGYGLLSYSDTEDGWVWQIRPKINVEFWRPQRRVMRHALRSMKDGG